MNDPKVCHDCGARLIGGRPLQESRSGRWLNDGHIAFATLYHCETCMQNMRRAFWDNEEDDGPYPEFPIRFINHQVS